MDACKRYLRDNWLALACLLVGICIVWGQLQYPSHWLNEWDESQYINSGRFLAQGKYPALALNPLIAVFYYPLFELFKSQPMWLFTAATWGHRLLFLGLWGVFLLVGKELFQGRDRAVLYVWPIVTAAFAGLATNSSEAAFTVFSGLAFWQMLRFRATNAAQHLACAGGFTALATLCRVDGIVLELILAIILVSFLYKRNNLHLSGQLGLALFAPFLAVVILNLFVEQKMNGSVYLGLKPRTYVAFEQGQGVVYADRFKNQNPLEAGRRWSEALYGSAEQNRNSILAAAAKNPNAFLARVERQAQLVPRQALSAYSDASQTDPKGSLIPGGVLLAAVLGGVLFLLRERRLGELGIFVTWTSFLAFYVLTFFQPSFFLMACFPVFAMAGFGLLYVVRAIESEAPRWQFAPAAVGLATLVFGLFAGVGRGIPSTRNYQASEAELRSAVAAIQKETESGGVVSSAPQIAFLARRAWIDPTSAPRESSHLRSWVRDRKAQTMVIDGRMQYDDPKLYTIMTKVAPKMGRLIKAGGDTVKVFKVKPVVAAESQERPALKTELKKSRAKHGRKHKGRSHKR